jgi:hypothetical protein
MDRRFDPSPRPWQGSNDDSKTSPPHSPNKRKNLVDMIQEVGSSSPKQNIRWVRISVGPGGGHSPCFVPFLCVLLEDLREIMKFVVELELELELELVN